MGLAGVFLKPRIALDIENRAMKPESPSYAKLLDVESFNEMLEALLGVVEALL